MSGESPWPRYVYLCGPAQEGSPAPGVVGTRGAALIYLQTMIGAYEDVWMAETFQNAAHPRISAKDAVYQFMMGLVNEVVLFDEDENHVCYVCQREILP